MGGAPAAHDPLTAQQYWLEAERENRCIAVDDEAMTPILAQGARVAYAAAEEAADDLDGALVVAWVQGRPLVRWFRRSGTYGLLRAENPEYTPSIHLLDLASPPAERMLRRVLWMCSPH